MTKDPDTGNPSKFFRTPAVIINSGFPFSPIHRFIISFDDFQNAEDVWKGPRFQGVLLGFVQMGIST